MEVSFRFRNKPHARHIFDFDPTFTIKEAVEIAMDRYPENCDFDAEAVYACNLIGEKKDVTQQVSEVKGSRLMVITDNNNYNFYGRMGMYALVGLSIAVFHIGTFFFLRELYLNFPSGILGPISIFTFLACAFFLPAIALDILRVLIGSFLVNKLMVVFKYVCK